jgi:hypothetical protein
LYMHMPHNPQFIRYESFAGSDGLDRTVAAGRHSDASAG